MSDLEKCQEQLASVSTSFRRCIADVEIFCAERDALKADAERYRWLFLGNKVYSQFRAVFDGWDGCGGKTGFDAAIDAAKEQQG